MLWPFVTCFFFLCLMSPPPIHPSPSPRFCSTTARNIDVLGNRHCPTGFYWRVERGIRIDEGLFEFQAQIKNLRPYSPFSLFIFPSLLPKWCQWKPSYRAIYRISPSHQNHMVQSRGTMTTSREESAWIETVNIYERASCHMMSLLHNMLRMSELSCARSHQVIRLFINSCVTPPLVIY